VNLEVTDVKDLAPTPAKYDLSDWLILGLISGGFIASWTYVFLHPSEGAFGICVGGVGTFGAIFHGLRLHDDKTPDSK